MVAAFDTTKKKIFVKHHLEKIIHLCDSTHQNFFLDSLILIESIVKIGKGDIYLKTFQQTYDRVLFGNDPQN